LTAWTKNSSVDERERLKLFEQTVLPHLDAAYNLARWLAGNDHDAQDVAQEASLRAFKFFGSFRGENARAWLLTIVRNTFYNWLRKNRPPEIAGELDDETGGRGRFRERGSGNLRVCRCGPFVRAPLPNCRWNFGKLSFYARWKDSVTKKSPTVRCAHRHGDVAPGARAQAVAKSLAGEFKPEVPNELSASQTAH
jgi:RNA polymerase sigma factor (sigma-70 family)